MMSEAEPTRSRRVKKKMFIIQRTTDTTTDQSQWDDLTFGELAEKDGIEDSSQFSEVWIFDSTADAMCRLKASLQSGTIGPSTFRIIATTGPINPTVKKIEKNEVHF